MQLYIPVYTVTLFASAFLLFLIQPLFGKMVLPLLGGSPAVWNTAMVFFQATLLAGYAYAHLLIRFLGPRFGALVHIAVLALATVILPLALLTPYCCASCCRTSGFKSTTCTAGGGA